jgi:hypothetical protein
LDIGFRKCYHSIVNDYRNILSYIGLVVLISLQQTIFPNGDQQPGDFDHGTLATSITVSTILLVLFDIFQIIFLNSLVRKFRRQSERGLKHGKILDILFDSLAIFNQDSYISVLNNSILVPNKDETN